MDLETKMKIDRREHGDLIVFSIDGDFDSRNAGEAKEDIRSTIIDGAMKVVINLEGVAYIDSAGLGTLVSALKTAKESGGGIWLCGLSDQVKMVVELTRLHHVFDIFDTLDEALEALCEVEEPEAGS